MFFDFSDDYIFVNNQITSVSTVEEAAKGIRNIYEVFRVISGSPLFVNDHFDRLEHSLKYSNINYKHVNVEEIKAQILQLCEKNNKFFGNVELRVIVLNNGIVKRYLGFIPHHYPDPINYIEGIKVDYMDAVRENPTVKSKYTTTRDKANAFIEENGQYEVLLVNNNGDLTEGSRSNLFFIKGATIYTAPDQIVLCGITRLNVIRLLKRMQYKIVYKAIKASEIATYDAAFICGTSPGVLPISAIRLNKFDVRNTILRNIISHHNDQISEYITSNLD